MKIDTIKIFRSSTLRLEKISLVILIPCREGEKGPERGRGGEEIERGEEREREGERGLLLCNELGHDIGKD